MNSLPSKVPPSSKAPNAIFFLFKVTFAIQLGALLVFIGLICFMSIVASPLGMICFATAGRIVSKSFGKYSDSSLDYRVKDFSDNDMLLLGLGKITERAIMERDLLMAALNAENSQPPRHH